MALVENDSEISFLNSVLGGMASESALKEIQQEVTCYICSRYFVDPVIIDCGHNFCQSCLINCWRDFFKTFTCPQCKKTQENGYLCQNKRLASLVILVQHLNVAFEETESKDPVCYQHQVQEPMRLFCKDDLVLLCSVCVQSLEHEVHVVVPVEEVTEEYKHCFSLAIAPLKQEKENMQTHKEIIEEEYQRLADETRESKEKMEEWFEKFYQFLEQQKQVLEAKFQKLLDEIEKKSLECSSKVFDNIIACNRVMQELEEKNQQPAGKFLQDIKGTMERFSKSTAFEGGPPFSEETRWGLFDLCDLNSFLEGALSQFTDMLTGGYTQNKANVNLDAETAHPRFIVSFKEARLENEPQNLPRSPQRFDECLFVLGCQGYAAGRHSWDVLVESEEDWAVGVAKKSVKRQGLVILSPRAGIWAVGSRKGQNVAFEPPIFPCLSLDDVEIKRIRVFLNCEGRQVTFFDADRSICLYASSITSDARDTFSPFFYLSSGQFMVIP